MSSPRLTRPEWGILGLVVLVAFLHGMLYAVLIPSWDLFDESAHLDYALRVRDHASIPHIDQPARDGLVAAVAESSWSEWRPTLHPSTDPADAGLVGLSYEGYQPPLYYAAVAVATAAAGDDLQLALYSARMTGPILLALLAAVTWGLARSWFPADGASVWGSAAVIVTAVPAAADAAGRVNNDLMAAVLVGAGVLAAVRLIDDARPRWSIALGMLGAAAILTKSPGIVMLGVIPVALVIVWRRHGLRPSVALSALFPPVAAIAAYAGFTRARYQTLVAPDAFLDLAVPFAPLSSTTAVRDTWLNAWSSYWTWHDGGNVRLAAGVVIATLVAGGIAAAIRVASLRPALVVTAVVLGGLLVMVWAGNRSGLVHPQGRLLIAAFPPLAALVAGGWARWFGAVGALGAAGACVVMSAVYFFAWFRPLFLA